MLLKGETEEEQFARLFELSVPNKAGGDQCQWLSGEGAVPFHGDPES